MCYSSSCHHHVGPTSLAAIISRMETFWYHHTWKMSLKIALNECCVIAVGAAVFMTVIVTNDKLLQSVKSRGTFHQESLYNVHSTHNIMCPVQCGLQGCKN